MKREKLMKLGPYALFLQIRWGLTSARAAGSLRDALIVDYREHKAPLKEIIKAHSRGWAIEDWEMCGGGITDENRHDYISTVDYRRMHPFNGKYSFWIDDKLTLKYLCCARGLSDLMPAYYFEFDGETVFALPDCPKELRGAGVEGVLPLLEQEGELAVKRIRGCAGEGFYKLAAIDGEIRVNNVTVSREELSQLLSGLDGYIVTEYLHPHPDLAKYCGDVANSVRYLVGCENGTPTFLTTCLRLGTKSSGTVENYHSGGIVCLADEDGMFEYGNIMDPKTSKNIRIDVHPDTGAPLRGKVPLWDEMTAAAATFCAHFPQLQYLGFDFVATDTGSVKMLEINSLTSLVGLQFDRSAFDIPHGDFFRKRLGR